jgi:predicted ester cyclase
MSAEKNKALMHHWFEECNKGKAATIAVIDETCATDFVLHSTSVDIRGFKAFKQHESEIFSAFPDFNETIDDMIVEGDKIVTRFTMTGTHKGEYMGIPPTNKKVTVWAISIDRVAGGKFVESWARMDTLGMMHQLGLIPTPKKEK